MLLPRQADKVLGLEQLISELQVAWDHRQRTVNRPPKKGTILYTSTPTIENLRGQPLVFRGVKKDIALKCCFLQKKHIIMCKKMWMNHEVIYSSDWMLE